MSAQSDRNSVCVYMCVSPVYEWVQHCELAVVELQQVGGQTEVAAQ